MTPTTDAHLNPEIAQSNRMASLWPLALVIALVVAVFAENIRWLFYTWAADEFYNHGFLIPIITGYLIYRKWDRLKQLPRAHFYGGIPVIILSLCLHFIASYLDVNFPSSFALIGVLIGLVWWLWGWHVLKELAFPLIFLLFMVPLGKLLIDQVAQPMQLLGARLAGRTAQFLGMPTVIDGVTLSTPEYTFEVAVACSGLKSAVSMIALGALLAYLIMGAWWQRLVVFATALPVAIVANAVRIGLTLVLGRTLGERAAEGFVHEFSGIVVFILAFLGLLGVTSLLGCRHLRDDI